MKNKKTLSSILTFGLIVMPIIFSGCGDDNLPAYRLDLEVWGVYDDSSSFRSINGTFAQNTKTTGEVKYRKISSNPEEYEKELIDAIASGKAPDVFFFKHTWLSKHKDKIAPLPGSEDFLIANKNLFADVFYTDFVEKRGEEREIYAMPLYCDTLALYYNKEMLNQAGIISPPETWEEVKEQTKKLTRIDEYGNIKQSAIALGRSKDPGSINRSTDILSLLMMQNGSIMSNDGKMHLDRGEFGDVNPGIAALDFYTQFAQGDSDVYTWNTKMDYSVDSFRFRKVAMMLNYSHMSDRLKRMDPKLQFEIAPAPQIDMDRKVNYADYWGLAVVKNKDLTGQSYTNNNRIKESWKYIKFLTGKPTRGFDAAKTYLDETNKIAARKDLIEEQKTESFRGVFAEQALTARSWRQPNEVDVEDIFVDMIDDTVSGNMTSRQALGTATSRIDVLWK